jgi:cysteine desulfurase/selenocysteine lyase
LDASPTGEAEIHGASDPPGAPDGPDFPALRALFPVTRTYAYFNVAANAPLATPVVAAMDGYLKDLAAHGSRHYRDWFATAARTRERAARLLGAESAEIALVRNTSDGISIVANGLALREGDSVVAVHGDFPANVHPWLRLREERVEVRLVRPDERGRITPQQLVAACDGSTKLIAVSWVHYLNGFRIDLDLLAELAARRGILLCVDAIQGLGALELDVRRTPIDFLAADGHKSLLGPEGLGIFYVRKDRLDRLRPTVVSWMSMKDPFDAERYRGELKPDATRFEFGSTNTAGIYGLAAALELLLETGVPAIERHVKALANRLDDGLRGTGYRVRSPRAGRERSGIVAFEPRSGSPGAVAARLLEAGVQVTVRGGAVRAAMHLYNDESDVERLLAALA